MTNTIFYILKFLTTFFYDPLSVYSIYKNMNDSEEDPIKLGICIGYLVGKKLFSD